MEKLKILGTDHKILDIDDFILAGKSKEDVLGIVYGTPIIGQRVLAVENWFRLLWNKDGVKLGEYNSSTSEAVQILSGMEDTKHYAALGDNDTAPSVCWKYGKGGLQWYLPSVMELAAIFLYRDKINDTIKLLDIDDVFLPEFDEDRSDVWSSTRFLDNYVWCINFNTGSFYPNEMDTPLVTTLAISKL